jgi:hypothetical protein
VKSDLAELCRFGAVLVRRAARDRVEADIGGLLVLEDPGVGAVGSLDQLRDVIFVLRGDMVVEHVRRFDHVVVD